jgi:hypothetical protein
VEPLETEVPVARVALQEYKEILLTWSQQVVEVAAKETLAILPAVLEVLLLLDLEVQVGQAVVLLVQKLAGAVVAAAPEVIPEPAVQEVVMQARLVLQQQQVVEQAAAVTQSAVLILHRAAAAVLECSVLGQTERPAVVVDLVEITVLLQVVFLVAVA